MSKCPYTWVTSLFKKKKVQGLASELRVQVIKEGICTVDVALPAHSARWLIDLIPGDVLSKIREECIPIEQMQEDLGKASVLVPESIFSLIEEHRQVQVWLE